MRESRATVRAPVRQRPVGTPLYHRRGPPLSTPSRRASVPLLVRALDQAAVLHLQRTAGNRAVAALLEPEARSGARGPMPVQRDIGWKDALRRGHAWNLDQREVGKIHRIPLEGLRQGMQEKAMISGLSPESAKGRAIVLVPASLDPKREIEVLIHLHGYTESTGRPYAGWRALAPEAVHSGSKGVKDLRHGIDELNKLDVAPVRDVALDEAEQQLEQSGLRQTVIVLPQGGLRSQFGKAGDYEFDSGAYVDEIVGRLVSEHVWKKAPAVGHVIMSGHSGASTTLAGMARESVRRQAGGRPGTMGTLMGDLVLFDAINEGDLEAFKDWALMRLNADLAALKCARTDAERNSYLHTAPKLRGYYSTARDLGYEDRYVRLQKAIDKWFDQHAAELGNSASSLYANFSIIPVDVEHEELIRGVPAGVKRHKEGGILDVLHALHAPRAGSAPACPATPAAKPRHRKGRPA